MWNILLYLHPCSKDPNYSFLSFFKKTVKELDQIGLQSRDHRWTNLLHCRSLRTPKSTWFPLFCSNPSETLTKTLNVHGSCWTACKWWVPFYCSSYAMLLVGCQKVAQLSWRSRLPMRTKPRKWDFDQCLRASAFCEKAFLRVIDCLRIFSKLLI